MTLFCQLHNIVEIFHSRVVVVNLECILFQLKVADNDIGKVIGKYGRIAKAMRTVLSASAVKDGKRYSLDILDN